MKHLKHLLSAALLAFCALTANFACHAEANS